MCAPGTPPKAPAKILQAPKNEPLYTVSISTIDDLGKHITEEDHSKFLRQQQMTSRISHKNLKNRSEAVWPDELESALLDALYEYAQKYGMEEIRRKCKKNLSRNRFISQHIFGTTNQLRTSKQVASRLQQLRRYTGDERIRQLLLKPIQKAAVKPLLSTRPLVTATDNRSTVRTLPEPFQLPITTLLFSAHYPLSPPQITLEPCTQPQSIQLRTLEEFQPYTSMLRGMDPTVILLSSTSLSLHSVVEVYKSGEPHWTGSTYLSPNGIHDGKRRYLTSIAGHLWKDISDDQSAVWSISHLIFRAETEHVEDKLLLAEIVYDFQPLGVEQAHPVVRRDTRAPKYRFQQVYPPPPPPRAAESTSHSGLASSKPQEGVYSASGMYYQESIAPTVHLPTRALSMSAIDVYSPFGTYAEGNVVSTGAESQQDCGVNSVYAAGSRSLSEPPFSSLDQWNMDWNKFEFTMTRLSRETETTLAPTIQFSAGHLNGHNSLTDAPAIVDSGPAIMSTIEHLSLPAAAYQVPTGKYLGHYPIHDY